MNAIAIWLLSLFATAFTDKSVQPEVKDQSAIQYSIVFRIQPNVAGEIAAFDLDTVIDTAAKQKVEFRPTDMYLARAERIFRNTKGKVTQDDSGKIKPLYGFCNYIFSKPYQPTCSDKFVD